MWRHPVADVEDHSLLQGGRPVLDQRDLALYLPGHLDRGIRGDHVTPVQLVGLDAAQSEAHVVTLDAVVGVQVVLLDGLEDDLPLDGEDGHLVVLPEVTVDDGPQDDGSHSLHVEVAVHRAGPAGPLSGGLRLGLGHGDELLPQLDGVVLLVLVSLQGGSRQQGLELLRLDVVLQDDPSPVDAEGVGHDDGLPQERVDLVHHEDGELGHRHRVEQGRELLGVLRGLDEREGIGA